MSFRRLNDSFESHLNSNTWGMNILYQYRDFTHLIPLLSSGKLHLLLWSWLQGNVLSLWGFHERTCYRAAQLHGQTFGSPSTETFPEPCIIQPAGGRRPPGHWGNRVKRAPPQTAAIIFLRLFWSHCCKFSSISESLNILQFQIKVRKWLGC